MYIAAGQGHTNPGDKILMSTSCLVTSVICYKFQNNLFEFLFYAFFSWFKMLMTTERPYHFTHLLQVSKKSLWSLILYKFFHDLIHVYSPGAGGIQPLGDKVLMPAAISCHSGHLLLVSNHRRQQFLKNPLFYRFPIQKQNGPNLTMP